MGVPEYRLSATRLCYSRSRCPKPKRQGAWHHEDDFLAKEATQEPSPRAGVRAEFRDRPTPSHTHLATVRRPFLVEFNPEQLGLSGKGPVEGCSPCAAAALMSSRDNGGGAAPRSARQTVPLGMALPGRTARGREQVPPWRAYNVGVGLVWAAGMTFVGFGDGRCVCVCGDKNLGHLASLGI